MADRSDDFDREVDRELVRRYGSDEPRPELEERVLEEMRTTGLLGREPGSSGWWRPLAAAAAALAVFALGLGAGSLWTGPGSGRPAAVADADDALYLLLLLEPVGAPIAPAGQEAALVDEYREWAGVQARAGRLVRGEKLGDAMRRLGPADAPTASSGQVVTGFFLLRAEDLEEARAVAESCPHLRHGGSIEVRPVEST